MKNIVTVYLTVGACAAIASVIVLAKDGKDAPSKIAYYAAVNAVAWPAMLVFAGKQISESMNESK